MTGPAPATAEHQVDVLAPVRGWLGRTVASVGLATGLMYYFGFVREQAVFTHFGVDLGTLGFSTNDFVLRSAGTLFVPVAAILVAATVAAIAYHLGVGLVARLPDRWQRAAWHATGILGLLALLLGLIGLVRRADPLLSPLLAPLCLGTGPVLLWLVLDGPGRPPAPWSTVPRAMRPARQLLAGALVLTSLFWGTATVAQQRGQRLAAAFERSLPLQIQAVVYSAARLQIAGPGVTVSPLEGKDSLYRFRYNGLRVLAHSGGHWFLLPVGWTSGNGATVIVLDDRTEGVRVDLAP